MKRFYTLSIVCILFAGGAFAHLASSTKILGLVKQITLKGQLDIPKGKSVTMPVEAYQTIGDLQVNFLTSLGDLNIAVVDEANQSVFQTDVNATAGSKLIIDLCGWESGEYTLLITNGLGGCLEGQFEI